MLHRSIVQFAYLVALMATSAYVAAAPHPAMTGLTLEQSIVTIAGEDLRIYFSSDLVKPSMRVANEPIAEDRVGALAEILAPHGLMLRAGLNDSWLVVRNPTLKPAASTTPELVPLPSPPTFSIEPKQVEEIVVSASRYQIQGATTAPLRTLSDIDLEFTPDIGDDAIRAAARLPGMASNGFSSPSNVRGGEIHETLVRLDGMRLYDPFHLKDFQSIFSFIDPRVVSSMDVYTGGFPARFGDRMSGVIDVESISPPDTLHHEIGLSFFNSSILSSGNFAHDRGEWIASARRSNLDILYDQFSDLPERPRYTDIFAKLSYELSDGLRITGNILRATDDIALADDVDREERAFANQSDTYAWLRIDQNLGPRMTGATTLSSTSIATSRNGTSEKLGVSSGRLDDQRSFAILSLQSEWTRIIGARLMFEFGGSIANMRARYSYHDEVDLDLLFAVPGAPTATSRTRDIEAQPDARQSDLFASLRLDITPRIAADIGLRWSQQDIAGLANTIQEPRVGFRYALSDSLTLRSNWGRFYQVQGINELQVNDGVTQFFEPQRSEHLVLGLDKRLPTGTLLRIEGYTKTMSRLRPRFENLLNTRVLLPELKPDRIRIAPQAAEALGIELSLNGRRDSLVWWGSIGFSQVEDKLIEGPVLRSWDQTYTFNAGLVREFSHWRVSSGLVYRSGWPTSPVSLDSSAAYPTAVVQGRNSDRLGAYGSLDIRIDRSIKLRQSELSIFAEIVNLTNRSNPCCIEYEIGDEEDAGALVLDQRYALPTIPSIGVTWTF